ncbi:tyrosine-type recombinase/integrase [Chloroflexota bacterium]
MKCTVLEIRSIAKKIVKRLAGLLRQEGIKLQEQNEASVESIAVIVHELRTLLTPLRASGELLFQELGHEPDSPKARLAQNIIAGANSLEHWLSEMQELMKSETGLLEVKLETVAPLTVLREVEVLLEVAIDNYYYPVIYTAVSTGLRQAELLGLRWRDLDLDLMSISVSQTLYKRRGVCTFREPKTSGSSRRVSMTPKLALFLKKYRAERESLYWQLGVPLTLDDLVFANHDGKPIDPSVLTHNLARIVRQIGLGRVRFHDLRHTFASLMLMRGAKPKVISEALGHASVAFTMDTYSHIIEGMQEDAMALLDEVLPSGVQRTSNERQGEVQQI